MGRIGKEIELKNTSDGTEYCNFSVAVNRPKGKDKEVITDWIPCTAWGKEAVFIQAYFHRGDMICIEGSLQTRKYADNDGTNKIAYSVRINRAEFCEKKRDGAVASSSEQALTEIADVDSDLPF